MIARARPAIGPGHAASGQGGISVEGWRARPLDGGTRRALADGELHIWSADLERAVPTDVLSGEELERARRVIRPRAQRRWLAARVFLRTLLASYLEQDPSSLPFSVQAGGKPVLAGRRRGTLHFNLSHSGSLAVCALSRGCAVGVDVQLTPPNLDERRLGARLLGAHEAARLGLLGRAERRRQALRAWAALEAERKRTGLGLGGGGERFSGPRPWLAQLDLADIGADPGEGAGAGAVALALPPTDVFVGSSAYFRLSDTFWEK